MIDVLIMGGTWNPNGEGVTNAFASHLDPAKFRARWIDYPADYGSRVTYADSVRAGREALINAIRATPNLVVLAGYSQGAGIAGDVADEIGRGMHTDLEVLGVALIADPARPAGMDLVGLDPGGYGITGQRHITGIPAWHVAAEGDPITALPEGSALRSIADLSAYWNMASLDGFIRWGQSLIETASSRQLQRWWSIENHRTWFGAARQARAYLFDGRHTDAYVFEGHARRLAEALNEEFGY
ncbi:cutinase family protein [Nocardia brasiliensis]|uniref:cutinase family protein n=1 Tax=Nocardia brasiliensis TaxID=37326 RepID=UPI00366E1196